MVAAAATCPDLPWTVLAAVGETETDHGRSAPNRRRPRSTPCFAAHWLIR